MNSITLFALMRTSFANTGASLSAIEGLYDTREDALEARGKILNTGKTTTANMMDFAIQPATYYRTIIE